MKSISLWSEPTVLVLLGLSAALDTIDQNTLLGYLKSWIGLGGTVLKWFISYLSNHCQTIKIGSTLPEPGNLIYGVPQESVLGPLLSLYAPNFIFVNLTECFCSYQAECLPSRCTSYNNACLSAN